ncbi:MAG TPA: NTP transferase domain-containing protein [Vicinamibacterales bacterium]|nr:NTP transferase domain-containing protein [Vicinamibacterales bacterium]
MRGPALVVMAAGLGSRYGGSKQIEGVGPGGELLLEYAIFDARRAGFRQVVFVTRPELEPALRAIAARLPGDLDVAFVHQTVRALPAWFTRTTRSKPWGTVHAVLAARDAVTTPFAVVNADDFYGLTAYDLAAAACGRAADSGTYAVIGFPLARTLSDHGPVARGICVTDHGRLVWLDEVRGIHRTRDGIVGAFPDGIRTLTGLETASMNFWVFAPLVFADLEVVFHEFLRHAGHDDEAEAALPEGVNAMIQSGRARVEVVSAPGPWFGVTHREDRPAVVAGLAELVRQGTYPHPLWGKT